MMALGTVFETSLRVLLLLSIFSNMPFSEERIGLLDFISVYAADYGYSPNNLHGHGSYRFSEYPQRRSLIRSAIKDLVLDRLVLSIETDEGFKYIISNEGKAFCTKLSSDYAEDYLGVATIVLSHTQNMTDDDLLGMAGLKTLLNGEGSEVK